MIQQLRSAKNDCLPIPVVLICAIYGRQAAQHTDSPRVIYLIFTALFYDVMSLFRLAAVPGHSTTNHIYLRSLRHEYVNFPLYLRQCEQCTDTNQAYNFMKNVRE